MPTSFDRLKTAIADRYEIERELGHGAMATTVNVKYIDATHIRATTVTHFTDESGRADYTTIETLSVEAG